MLCSYVYFCHKRSTMKSLLWVAITLLITNTAKPADDTKMAKDYIFWVWNRYVPDMLVTQNPAQKALVEKKVKQLIENIEKSKIDLGTAVINSVYSIEAIGTGNRVLLVMYKANGTYWDDVVLYIDKASNKIIDIGDVETAFTMSVKTNGRNFKYKENLPFIFDKNAISSKTVLNEVQILIGLANNHKIDSFCRRVLYTGTDNTKRKNRAEACNPAVATDKVYCSGLMEKLSGYITEPSKFEVQYMKVEDKQVSLKIICDQTKNVRELVFMVVNAKLLLSSIY